MDYILLSTLANEFGLDRSNTRKYVLKHGFSPSRVRDMASRQMNLALTSDEAEQLREMRAKEGYAKTSVAVVNGEIGYFYAVLLIPDLDARRVKLGFASDVNTRLAAHRTASPTATVIKSWSCKRNWERAAMDSATRAECQLIANEVYQCGSVEQLIRRLDEFFSIMPLVTK